MDNVSDRFGNWIKEGFELYKDNFVVLFVASLIASVLSCVTAGILLGPMYAGVLLIALRLRDKTEPAPSVGDVFSGFSYFLQTFLFFLVWGIIFIVVSIILILIPCIGSIVDVCLLFAAGACLMFAPFLIIERRMDFWDASLQSFHRVKKDFWPFLGLFVIAWILGNIGCVLCGIGAIFTMPLLVTIITVVYRDFFQERRIEDSDPFTEAGAASAAEKAETEEAGQQARTATDPDGKEKTPEDSGNSDDTDTQ